jgi:O-acetyl-ADP-ribose deacetylase (regulator of RNase III)
MDREKEINRTQADRRRTLIEALLQERKNQGVREHIRIPENETEQKRLLRSLFNLRMPEPVSDDFLAVQDAYLQEVNASKTITDLADLTPVREGIYLWQGDITALRCDAIVNAANSQLLGCFCPCHGCIDNQIHTYAGVQLRLACAQLMEEQGCEEETGRAKITPAYNLPCRYVLHTVGPIIRGPLTRRDEELLASCYRSCLALAEENQVKSVAFCCISTGEFHFPNRRAAEIAVRTVTDYRRNGGTVDVIFNVFKDLDAEIYRTILTSAPKIEIRRQEE